MNMKQYIKEEIARLSIPVCGFTIVLATLPDATALLLGGFGFFGLITHIRVKYDTIKNRSVV